MSRMVRKKTFFCLTSAFLLVLLLFAFSVVAPPPPPPPTPPPPSDASVPETGQTGDLGASYGQEFVSSPGASVVSNVPQTVEGKLALLEKQVAALQKKSDYSLPVLVLFLLNIVTLILVLYILLKPQKTVSENYK